MNILCPYNQPCIDDVTSLGNFSSEDPDLELFRSTYFRNMIWDNDMDIWTACMGLCVSTVSQADADLCAQNNAKICEATKQFGNSEYTGYRTCCDGNQYSMTVPANTFYALSQAQANALAVDWCNDYLTQLCDSIYCPGTNPNPGPAPQYRFPRAPGRRACNDVQSIETVCVDGGKGIVIPPCYVLAANKEAANVRARDYADQLLSNNVGCLIPLFKSICKDSVFSKFIVPDRVTAFVPPLSWEVFGVVPPGLDFTPSGIAMKVSGKFEQSGLWGFRLTLSDTRGTFTYRTYRVSVMEIDEPAVLPNGREDDPYSHAISTVEGYDPKTFSVISGTLPPGLSIDSGTGVISGTPTMPGTYTFTVRVRDFYTAVCEKEFTLTIDPNIFGGWLWLLTETPQPLGGTAYANGTGGHINIGAIDPGGTNFVQGGVASGSTLGPGNWILNNTTGAPISCRLRVVVTSVGRIPPTPGVQCTAYDICIFRRVTPIPLTNIVNVAILLPGTWEWAFTVPVGISTWYGNFHCGATSAGSPPPAFPGGSNDWVVTFSEL